METQIQGAPTEKMTEADVLQVLGDPATHTWVKEQYHKAFDRDPVDAFCDCLTLARMLQCRMRSILNSNPRLMS